MLQDIKRRQSVAEALIRTYSTNVDYYEVPTDFFRCDDESVAYSLSGGNFSVYNDMLDKPLWRIYQYYVLKEIKALNEMQEILANYQKK